MGDWNFADVWETVASQIPEAPAQIHGDRRVLWSDFDARANGVAQWLLDLGIREQDKVAQYLYNCTEYLESLFGVVKAGCVPVNTNYRYNEEELLYLWENADAVAVVFHGTFTERIEPLRNKLDKVKGWLWVDDGSGPCPEWATPYDSVASKGTVGASVQGPWGRSGDHIVMLYTGGTTGMPKGVMWRQDDLIVLLMGALGGGVPEEADLNVIRERVQKPGAVALPACPLMHGTGLFSSFVILSGGGSIVTMTKRNFDVEEFLDTIEREKVFATAIVGDAFAKPMLRVLDENPGRWDISGLFAITSSGVMWSEETKQGLLRHNPNLIMQDAFSSSEALGMGSSVSGGGAAAKTAKFMVGEHAVVITEDGRLVEPGSAEIGMVGVKGRVPLGYYKDEEKSAKTFRVIDGVRYSIPGDFATVEADGSLTLLGRGSVCINTGGEKVFPEEVEEVLKRHPSVRDAVVVGVPDEKWGEAITAMVEPAPDVSIDEDEIIGHVKSILAAYKAPKRVLEVSTIGRAANGKVDYKRLKSEAVTRVGT